MLIEVPLKDEYQNLPLTNQQPFILQNTNNNANISHVSETPFENCFGLNKIDENNNNSESSVDNNNHNNNNKSNNNDNNINTNNDKNSSNNKKIDSKLNDNTNEKSPKTDQTKISSVEKTPDKVCNGHKSSLSVEPLAVSFLSSVTFSPSATLYVFFL